MNPDYYSPIPCGTQLPLNNPHAFSVSMPTYQDVIDYEEEQNDIFSKIKTAYPRIIFHPYIKMMSEVIANKCGIENRHLFLLPSSKTAKTVSKLSSSKPEICEYRGYAIAHFDNSDKESINRFYSFMKHCGYTVYSREAEKFLRSENIDIPIFEEKTYSGNSQKRIESILKNGYKDVDEMILSSSGMNAIYSSFEAVKQRGELDGRSLFIQFGWVYSDTIAILKKLSGEYISIPNVYDIDKLKLLLESRGHEVAGLITETISNPLLQTPDLPEISALSKKHKFPIILDNTFATPWNCKVTDYCDLIIESLTKFASGKGDIMGGVVIRPKKSSLPPEFCKKIREFIVPPFAKERDRLAETIGDYENRMETVNSNSKRLVKYFENHPMVKELHHINLPENRDNYSKISSNNLAFGGVISVVLKGKFSKVYDSINLPKGPSLGCDFPLLMPYTLLAHYDLASSKEGQEFLKEINLSPNLIRISVGEGDPSLIIKQFEKAFSC
jgi:cystathionine gamma-synthase